MSPWVLLVGGLILVAVGAWTVTHPNGSYRAAGGVGSSFTPATRRLAGFVLLGVAVVLVVSGVNGAT